MKRAYGKSQYAKPCEQYCRETYPHEADAIFQKAEEYYLAFLKDMPDLGENMMAKNMLDWFTILAFYESSDNRLDGETLLGRINCLNVLTGILSGCSRHISPRVSGWTAGESS